MRSFIQDSTARDRFVITGDCWFSTIRRPDLRITRLREVAIHTVKLHAMKTADISAVLTSAQLLLSMVETRRAARNGDGADPAAPQELARIERQLGKLESLDGQSADVRREIEDLRQRVTALRDELSHREAWVKTELARHPQRPYFLD